MKHKFSSMGRVAIALVLALSLSLVMAVPVAASHDSTATIAFTDGQSTEQNDTSTLDVEVTNSAGSLGNIDEVVIDFSGTDFTGLGEGTLPGTWTLVDIVGGVITYTDATGIAPGDSVTFVPAVTNPGDLGLATNPIVTTSDVGSKAVLAASAATGQIAYTADAIGSAGNDFTVEYLDAESFSELSAAMVGNAISVELADDGTDPTSDADAVVAAINAVATGVTASTAAGATIVPVMSAAALSGGSGVQLDKPCTLTGTLTITEKLLDVTVTATPETSASLASYDIAFTIEQDIVATDGWITITFPAEYDISTVVEGLAGDVTMTVTPPGGPYTPSAITKEGQVVTITAGNAINTGDAVVITIADHVKNPPVSADYDIIVATSGEEHGPGAVTIIPDSFKVVAGTLNEVTAGAAFAVTVTALNAEVEPETDIGYTGDHFIDFVWVVGPAGTPTLLDFDLITFTAGIGTSDQYFVLTDTSETPAITATEGSLTGDSDPITINPATFVGFLITGEPVAAVTAGDDFGADDIIVTAQDADGNTVIGYTGTVSWTSTDGQALLPAAYTFDAEDEGVHTFLGSLFTLKTVDTVDDQIITVTDAAAEISQDSALIEVVPAAAASIVVSASPGVIEADNSDSSTITATAKDEFGNTDTTYTAAVTFAESLGVLANEDATFTGGVATADLTSNGELGTATVKVTPADLPYALTTVKLLPDIGITTITVTVDKSTILNNDVDVRTITATYVDTDSETVTAAEGADYAFTFSVNDPDTVLLSTTDPVNPIAGVATVTLTTTIAAGADAITVTADGTGATDGTVNITVAEGTFPIELLQGWNLISVPLIPDVAAIETVLADLIDAGTVDWVDTFVYEDGQLVEKKWDPPAILQITEINAGQGYWVSMTSADTLTISGLELPAPPNAPPTYQIYEGWNLIGFKSLDDATNVEDYLGEAIAGSVLVAGTLETMYGYNAATGVYTVVLVGEVLVPGAGYWLAVNADGTIYP